MDKHCQLTGKKRPALKPTEQLEKQIESIEKITTEAEKSPAADNRESVGLVVTNKDIFEDIPTLPE